jgi:hypothetical protein
MCCIIHFPDVIQDYEEGLEVQDSIICTFQIHEVEQEWMITFFLFETLVDDMEKGIQSVNDHYARLGLAVRVERGNKKSKTEAPMNVPTTSLNQEPSIPERTRIKLRRGAHIQIKVSCFQGNFQAESKPVYCNYKVTSERDERVVQIQGQILLYQDRDQKVSIPSNTTKHRAIHGVVKQGC